MSDVNCVHLFYHGDSTCVCVCVCVTGEDGVLRCRADYEGNTTGHVIFFMETESDLNQKKQLTLHSLLAGEFSHFGAQCILFPPESSVFLTRVYPTHRS